MTVPHKGLLTNICTKITVNLALLGGKILKHNFWGKVMLSASMLLAVGGTSIAAAAADTPSDSNANTDNTEVPTNTNDTEVSTEGIDTRAKGTWTITNVSTKPWGAWAMNKNYPNIKRTNSNYASFNGDAQTAQFGYKVRLQNNKGAKRSDTTGLYVNQTTHAGNNTGRVGLHYYGGVRTSPVDPSGSYIKFHFSADNK